ncbi:hypothetical protein ECANGB1_187 [Enterospora canceri]|uniref:Uncharacterized protein n=1 Tax=Enterospora canceri TaxID=1081671 RepID=A0A1Y1S4J7_9MICR|nr:hypothetical protein ECANGB1_187 [Enterospora canceri]
MCFSYIPASSSSQNKKTVEHSRSEESLERDSVEVHLDDPSLCEKGRVGRLIEFFSGIKAEFTAHESEEGGIKSSYPGIELTQSEMKVELQGDDTDQSHLTSTDYREVVSDICNDHISSSVKESTVTESSDSQLSINLGVSDSFGTTDISDLAEEVAAKNSDKESDTLESGSSSIQFAISDGSGISEIVTAVENVTVMGDSSKSNESCETNTVENVVEPEQVDLKCVSEHESNSYSATEFDKIFNIDNTTVVESFGTKVDVSGDKPETVKESMDLNVGNKSIDQNTESSSYVGSERISGENEIIEQSKETHIKTWAVENKTRKIVITSSDGNIISENILDRSQRVPQPENRSWFRRYFGCILGDFCG